MSILQAIRDRHSIRAYQPRAEVSDAHIHDLLEAAMLAPSACNARPWEFFVVRTPALLDALSAAHPHGRMLATASLAIVVCAKPDAQSGISEGFYPQDCAAATENMLLQATSLGLGTCWCGVYPHDHLISMARELLCVPDALIPFNIIAVGVPEKTAPARGKYEEERVHTR